MKNITAVQKWAKTIQDVEVRRTAKRHINEALAKGGKKLSRLETLFNAGAFQNLYTSIDAMQVERYSGQDRVCDLCGTHHKSGCLLRWEIDGEARIELAAGGTCKDRLYEIKDAAQKFDAADKKAIDAHSSVVAKHLDDLLSSEQLREAILVDSTPRSVLKHPGSYVLNWVADVASDELKEEIARVRDEYGRLDQATMRKVTELIVEQKKRPASSYRNIVKDLKLMEQEGLAPKHLHTGFTGMLTTKDVNDILSFTDEHYRDFRVRKNKAAQVYDSMDSMLADLKPIIDDSRKKAARDYQHELWITDKVFAQRETGFLLRVDKNWMGLKYEPVQDFAKDYARMALLHGKFQYALEAVQEITKNQDALGLRARTAQQPAVSVCLENIAEAMKQPSHLVDESYKAKIAVLERCYSNDKKITAVQPKLGDLKQMAEHHFLPDKERKMIDRAYKVADLRCRPIERSNTMYQKLAGLVRSGAVTQVDTLDVQKFKDENMLLDWKLLERPVQNRIHNSLYFMDKRISQGEKGEFRDWGTTYTIGARN